MLSLERIQSYVHKPRGIYIADIHAMYTNHTLVPWLRTYEGVLDNLYVLYPPSHTSVLHALLQLICTHYIASGEARQLVTCVHKIDPTAADAPPLHHWVHTMRESWSLMWSVCEPLTYVLQQFPDPLRSFRIDNRWIRHYIEHARMHGHYRLLYPENPQNIFVKHGERLFARWLTWFQQQNYTRMHIQDTVFWSDVEVWDEELCYDILGPDTQLWATCHHGTPPLVWMVCTDDETWVPLCMRSVSEWKAMYDVLRVCICDTEEEEDNHGGGWKSKMMTELTRLLTHNQTDSQP